MEDLRIIKLSRTYTLSEIYEISDCREINSIDPRIFQPIDLDDAMEHRCNRSVKVDPGYTIALNLRDLGGPYLEYDDYSDSFFTKIVDGKCSIYNHGCCFDQEDNLVVKKPVECIIYPLKISNGILTISEDVKSGSILVTEKYKESLEEMFGTNFIRELDSIKNKL